YYCYTFKGIICDFFPSNLNKLQVPNFVPECPNIDLGERVDCFPESGASMLKCAQRGCCWQPLDDSNAPWCFFPANQGYEVTKRDTVLKRLAAPPMFQSHIEELVCHEEMQTPNRFRFQITDSKKQRFEVPHEHVKPPPSPPGGALKYEVELLRKPFGLKLRRADTKRILFDTTMGPLVFADQYLQLSARLPSHNIYGLGEHVHQSFKHDTNWRTWPIFTRDSFPNGITLQPAPAVTYRTIGGVLDFYILLGNSPEAVVQEFLELIGRPMIPPYWSLGFQLSRWGYSSLDEVKQTVERNRAIGLPYDVQFTDIDYMEEKKDFTYDLVKFKDLPQFADYMHAAGQKYVLILDPAIAISPRVNGPYASYDRGNQKKVWVTEADGETPLEGEVWPGQTVFPDYTNPACKEWWTDEIRKFHEEVKHDALWIVRTEH
uniref:P-type domain-containing protein n=1 Tax=Paramormyrops kingsleyae TaxID=1676925 RepID=A0A3B3QRW4_9TELE